MQKRRQRERIMIISLLIISHSSQRCKSAVNLPTTCPPVPAGKEELSLPRLPPPVSPPVPALARKIAVSEPPHLPYVHMHPPCSLPVPAIARRIGISSVQPPENQLDNRTNEDFKMVHVLQNLDKRLKEQEILIEMLLKEKQEHRQRQGDKHQILKQLANLKVVQCINRSKLH